MLILDTDHLSEINRRSSAGQILAHRLALHEDTLAIPIVVVEEHIRGLFAAINRSREPKALALAYPNLQDVVDLLRTRRVLPWNDDVMTIHARLLDQGIRIGTMDLRIASIVLAHGGILLSRNLRDFERVPDLKVENGLE